ncbi:hypothetical protein ACOSQ2_004286 [Xanthoceras sorbifolium]
MYNTYYIPQDSRESDYARQTNFEFSDYFTLNDWLTFICDKEKKQIKERVAFRTKSEVELLDDGFKWRKYGKKVVKNSPHPRNYYKCSSEGCPVKKRVERDTEDPSCVHNHEMHFPVAIMRHR